MKKRNLIFLFLVMAIVFLPKNVFADTVQVRLRAGQSYDSPIIDTVSAERGVTTIGEVRELFTAKGVDLSKYMFFKDYDFVEYEDDDVICTEEEGLYCYSDVDTDYFYYNAWTIDSKEIKLSFKSIPPTDEEMFMDIVETNWELLPEGLSYKSCNSSYTLCSAYNMMDYKIYDNIVFNYNYDKNIYALAKAVIDAGALDNIKFKTTDTEFLHFLNYGGSLADYTSSFKSRLANTNFSFEMDQRAGGDDLLETHAAGFYKFLYGGTLYGVKPFVSVTAEHVIYVPTGTTDVVKAIQERLKTLFGSDNKLTVAKCNKTINQVLAERDEDPVSFGSEECYTLSKEEKEIVGMSEDGYEYDTVTRTWYFRVVKDSSKINNSISFKSSDLVTKVSVSTEEAIPFDTLVVVSKLVSGDTYTGLLKTLGIDDGEVFDINLHSNSQDKNITKLSNGKFLVRIPIPEKYVGKNLIVYYVDSKKNISSYKVTPKKENGVSFAEFETDHFSIYTLTDEVSAYAETDTNPKTGDNIIYYMLLFILSSIILTICFRKKENN